MKKMMIRYILRQGWLYALLLVAMPAWAAPDPAEGLWLIENKRSVIELEQCDLGLCGYIYWIVDGGMIFDTKNPDISKRSEPICGLPIVWGFKQSGTGIWNSGKIYKADDGDMYDANISVNRDGTLRVRGYMGVPFLGQTQTWTRVNADDYPICRLPETTP